MRKYDLNHRESRSKFFASLLLFYIALLYNESAFNTCRARLTYSSGLSEPIISRLMREDEIGGITYASARAIAQWLEVSTDDLADEVSD